MFFFSSGVRWILPIAVAVGLASVWIRNKSYAFNEAELIRVTQKHIGSQTFGQDHRTAFAAVAKELLKRHPNAGIRRVEEGRFRWMWTRFGGFGRKNEFRRMLSLLGYQSLRTSVGHIQYMQSIRPLLSLSNHFLSS